MQRSYRTLLPNGPVPKRPLESVVFGTGRILPPKRRRGSHIPTRTSVKPPKPTKEPKPPASVEDCTAFFEQTRSGLDAKFARKERLSRNFDCFKAPDKVAQLHITRECDAVLRDKETLPTDVCNYCQRMTAPADMCSGIERLPFLDYYCRLDLPDQKRLDILAECNDCFPAAKESATAPRPVCKECHAAMTNEKMPGLPKHNKHNQTALRCVHLYPDVLRKLNALEEKCISINGAYGFIQKLRMDLKWCSASYRKHVKGQICVFPNPERDMSEEVLPRVLHKTLDNVFVVWSGNRVPTDQDISHYLVIDPERIRAALVWLKEHNPLYKDIIINEDELTFLADNPNAVTERVRAAMSNIEPTVDEQMQTAHYTTADDRGEDQPISEDNDVMLPDLLGAVRDPEAQSLEAEDEAFDPLLSEPSPINIQDQTDYELGASAVLGVDNAAQISNPTTLNFLLSSVTKMTVDNPSEADAAARMDVDYAQTATGQTSAVVRIQRGLHFAESNDPDFWAKLFPTLFPWGSGGPRVFTTDENGLQTHTGYGLETWARHCLLRHGGFFAHHPVFPFLVFNILLRSTNRRVSMQRMSQQGFQRLEAILPQLTTERLERAAKELEDHGHTSDADVQLLMGQLASYGYSQPLSNEERLQIRRRMQSSIVYHGLPAIWFTINPNDLANPIKFHLSGARSDIASDLARLLEDNWQRMKLATEDPVSAAIFFHREVSVLCNQFIRRHDTGLAKEKSMDQMTDDDMAQEQAQVNSLFGHVSHYTGGVETNERGMLHLHGIIWLTGNLGFPDIGEISITPEHPEHANLISRLVSWADSAFCEQLDEARARATFEQTPNRHIPSTDIQSSDPDQAWEALVEDANMVALKSNYHTHTATCWKYHRSRKGKFQVCRFGAPWVLVPKTHMSKDGVLRLARGHPRVNRYNRAFASAFRYNHDFSFMLTKARSLSSIFYITNYASKLSMPMFKRLVWAAQVREALDANSPQEDLSSNEDPLARVYANKARQFLMRTANKMSTDREFSAVEIVAHLLGYPSFISPLDPKAGLWPTIHMNSVYRGIIGHWTSAKESVLRKNPSIELASKIALGKNGRKLSHIEAYPFRGPVFRDLCLYDYVSLIKMEHSASPDYSKPEIVPFPKDAQGRSSTPSGWYQRIRSTEAAIPVLCGYVDSDFENEDFDFPYRAALHHLGLFVPWEDVQCEQDSDLTRVWNLHKELLSPRIQFHMMNIAHLRKSAEDSKMDAKQWAERSAGAEVVGYDAETGIDGLDDEALMHESDQYDTLREIIRSSTTQVSYLDTLNKLNVTLESNLPELPYIDGRDPSNCGVFHSDVSDIRKSISGLEADAMKKLDGSKAERAAATFDGLVGAETRVYAQEHPDSGNQSRTQSTPALGAMDVFFKIHSTWAAGAEDLIKQQKLNTRQSLVLRRVAGRLDLYQQRTSSTGEIPQTLIYVGGGGGVGKSWLILALERLFESMGERERLQLTASTGSAAANINGRTLHSATGLKTRGQSSQMSSETQARWKATKMLVIDEISMVGGDTFDAVNQRLNDNAALGDTPTRQIFGGVPIVLLLGDFAQFSPVDASSLILPHKSQEIDPSPEGALESTDELNNVVQDTNTAETRDTQTSQTKTQAPRGRKVDAATKHNTGYKLFKLFKDVIILDEQMRARTDSDFMEMLAQIREGKPSEKYLQRMRQQVLGPGERIDWASGTRAITPSNASRMRLNMDAVMSWARAHDQEVRIFISHHCWASADPQQRPRTLAHGDDSSVHIPGIFWYTDGMPVITTKNQMPGLKLMNGTEFTAVGIVPDKDIPGIPIAERVFLHFGPPAAILLKSESTSGLEVPGLPKGVLMLTPDTETMKSDDFRFLTAKCYRRGLGCVAAFALTDYKAQGKTFDTIVVELCGRRKPEHKVDAVGMYVSLSRCKTLAGIRLARPLRERDWFSVIPKDLREGLKQLESQSDKTMRRWAKRDRIDVVTGAVPQF